MDLVEDLVDPVVPIAKACHALGVSRATLYRNTRPAPPRCMSHHARSPRRVSDGERAKILDTFHSLETSRSSKSTRRCSAEASTWRRFARCIGSWQRTAKRRNAETNGVPMCTQSRR
jgi:hypothetical protein